MLSKQLAAAGHTVIVIGRNPEHLKELPVQTAIGSLEDVDFLKRAFEGADAVYTMVPPNPVSNDQMGYHEMLARNYADAITHSGIRYVVNLSSMGAHLATGGGLPSGLHRVENILNTLPVNIKHIRASYFYLNLMTNISLIKQMGIMGNNYSVEAGKLPIAAAVDIAAAAGEELQSLNFKGHSVRYVVSDETGTDEIASVIGQAIGQAQLPWVRLEDEQMYNAMLQFGLSKDLANAIVQTGSAIDKGILMEDYYLNRPAVLGAVRLPDFAKLFAHVYQSVQ